jgi:hypothetical protein
MSLAVAAIVEATPGFYLTDPSVRIAADGSLHLRFDLIGRNRTNGAAEPVD